MTGTTVHPKLLAHFWKVSGGVGPFIHISRNNTDIRNERIRGTKKVTVGEITKKYRKEG